MSTTQIPPATTTVPKGTQQAPTALSKMNVKACGCDPKDAIRTSARVYLLRIFGEINKVITKESKLSNEPYSYLAGEFVAISGKDGEVFASDTLYLPGGIQEKLEAMVQTSGGKPVVFGYDIFAEPNDKSAVGYAYVAQAVRKTEASNRLDALAAELALKPLPNAAPVPEAPKVEPAAQNVADKQGEKKK